VPAPVAFPAASLDRVRARVNCIVGMGVIRAGGSG
jgi:hypothetical protein